MKKDYIFNLIQRIINAVTTLILVIYLSSILSQENYGMYVYLITIISLGTLVSSLGLNEYGSKMYLDNVSKDAYSSVLSMQIINSILVTVIIFIVTIVGNFNTLLSTIVILNILCLSIQPLWYNIAKEKITLNSKVSILTAIINLILILLLVKDDENLINLLLIVTFINFIRCILIIATVKKKYKFQKEYITLSTYKEYLIIFFPYLCISMYTMIDKLMLANISGLKEVAIYNNGIMILRTSLMIIHSVSPIIMVKNIKKIEDIENSINRALNIVVYISICLMFIFIGIGKDIVEFIFNSQYFIVSYILIYGSILIPIISGSIIIANGYFIPKGKSILFTKAVFVGASINIILNLLLIPKYGAFGGVLATIIAEIIIFLIMLFNIKNILNKKNLIFNIIKALVINIFAILIVHNLNISITLIAIIVKSSIIILINSIVVFNILKGEFY